MEADQITKTTSETVETPHVKNPNRVAAATRLAASRARAKKEKQESADNEVEPMTSLKPPSLATALSVVGIVIGIVNIFMWCKRPHETHPLERDTSTPVVRRRGME